MKLEKIQELWSKDCGIDITNLTNQSANTAKLHSVYYNIYIHEKMILSKFNAELAKLKLLKYDYYVDGLDKETLDELGWKPFKKRVLKTDVQQYLDSDEDIINMNLKNVLQKEKVDFVSSILKNISTRQFHIKNIIEWERFKNGLV